AEFPVSGWIELEFASPVREHASERIALFCDGAQRALRVHRIEPVRLALDPVGELDAASHCELRWPGADGEQRLRFATAPRQLRAEIPYDRENLRQIAPYPDDYWLASNPADPAEQRLRVRMSGFGATERWLMNALASGVRDFDGFSPVAHLTIPLSALVDPASIPHTPEQSLDPLASIALIDVTPGDPRYASRVPFRLEARTEEGRLRADHALLLFPSVALEPRHRYGIVVTRRVRSRAGAPFDPSAFFEAVRDGSRDTGERWSVARAGALVDEVLAAAAAATPSIERADVAFAARFTIRSFDHLTDDLGAIREQIAAAPPPEIEIARVVADAQSPTPGSVAAIVHGSWTTPDWRDAALELMRRPPRGAPRPARMQRLPFVLALPRAAYEHRVPVVMYQHGNPGSAQDEVVVAARDSLAAAGFAVIGFTDVMNREVSPPGPSVDERARRQIIHLLLRLMASSRLPDDFTETVAEQLAFLRAIREISAIPSFAIEAPRAGDSAVIHGIDAELPLTYLGVSEGAHHGGMLLPFAPEIRAAALVSPGRRFSEVLIHQGSERLRTPLAFLGFRRLTPLDVWVALALTQQLFDDEDPHNFARFLYREPLPIDPSRRASVLVVEGLGDTLIPNHATQAWVRALGSIPLLGPPDGVLGLPERARRASETAGFDFERVSGSVRANVDASTTAAFYQFVPRGVDGVAATPGCDDPALSDRSAREGHYCAQSAAEAQRQRARFFQSALGRGAPEIIDPLAHPE
ncbi:MAG TPA: hypothetical protein VEC18_00090, partial [Myxococcota bacterium]|nr:hypothetical protein [Myxococcota bacterium]